MLGENVVIARAGKPVARLVRVASRAGTRKLGTAQGQVGFSKGWDAPMNRKELGEFLSD
jgi:antitoxin (DNA-binding transcriptional repressor) of toxin-antitoxin stability system